MLQVDVGNVLRIFAETYQSQGLSDGMATAATFANPSGIVAAQSGDIFCFLHMIQLFYFPCAQMTSAGVMTVAVGTLSSAGFSGDGGSASNALLNAHCISIE